MSQENSEPMAFTPSNDPGDHLALPARIVLSERDFAEFMRKIDSDEEPNKNLRALFANSE